MHHKAHAFMILGGLMLLAAACAAFLITQAEPMSYHTNIIKDTEDNADFRRVLFTGQKSQLVVMSIPPVGEAPPLK